MIPLSSIVNCPDTGSSPSKKLDNQKKPDSFIITVAYSVNIKIYVDYMFNYYCLSVNSKFGRIEKRHRGRPLPL